MSLLSSIAYRLNVDIIGKAVLRLSRRRGERALRRRGDRPGPLSPPLLCSPHLKELISRHYLRGRFASGHRPVAWVTSGGPIEHLQALGYFLIYPENHGAVCGIRRTAQELCQVAEEAGFSRDICSYARTDIGSVLSGRTPVGRLPRPDLLVCCTNICQTVLYWYQVLAHHFRVPLVLVDTPFLYRPAEPHTISYVRRQIEEAIPVMERVARRALSPARLERVLGESKQAVELWMQVLERGKARPSPILAFDEFIHMAPIVEMRGEPDTTEYYRVLLAELDRRVAAGVGALRQERRRLIWDNLPIWYRVRPLSDYLASRGVALVASSYTNAWGELAPLMDPRAPLDSLARVYLHPILNRSTGDKLRTLSRMVNEYQAQGVLLHSDRSCKPYSVGQMDQREHLGRQLSVPALLLEADHNDPRSFSEEQVAARLEAFLEVVLS